MQRMRRVSTLSRRDQRRNDYASLNTHRPLLSYPEVAAITGLTEPQVKRAEHSAFQKIRAALVAYGYKDPTA